MNNRKTRLPEIIDILNQYAVASQEELVILLANRGHKITQATLSRDLKILKAAKEADGQGNTRYVIGKSYIPPRRPVRHKVSFKAKDGHHVLSVAVSGSIAVIKTRNGYASGLAYDLDMLDSDIILGTIPGADTVIVVLREGTPREDLRTLFSAILPPAVMDAAALYFS